MPKLRYQARPVSGTGLKEGCDLRAILYAQRADRYAEMLPPLPPEVEVIPCTTEEAALAVLPGAVALATWSHEAPARLLQEPGDLRWVHALGAGVEKLLDSGRLPEGVMLTNSRGANAPPIAEHVIGLMLAFARQFPRWLRQQQEGRWEPDFRAPFELAGRTCGILGLGSIGREVARRARALGMRVAASRQCSVAADPDADRLLPPAGVMAEADFVVVALPLTPATRGMVDGALLARMKPSAYLINVARGAIVDEPALIQALASGRIAGAGLDVFATEPLPPESPLWTLPNVIITPHVSAASPHTMARVMALWADNLVRFAGGQPLRNVVDRQRGY